MSECSRDEIGFYLKELATLLGRNVTESELGSPTSVRNLAKRSDRLVFAPSAVWQVPFQTKHSEEVRGILRRIEDVNRDRVLLLTPRSRSCGSIVVQSVGALNLDFPFSLNPEGIFTLVAEDACNRLVFDFFRDENGVEVLELEIQGAAWTSVVQPPR